MYAIFSCCSIFVPYASLLTEWLHAVLLNHIIIIKQIRTTGIYLRNSCTGTLFLTISPSCIVPYVAGVGEGKEQIPYYKGFSALDRHLFTQLWLLLVTTKVWPAENPYLGWLACCWCPRPPPGTRRWRTAAGTAAATSFSSLSHPHVCGGRWCAF